MSPVDEQGRTDPPVAADEAETMLGFLEFHRDTLAWKCAGLDAARLSTTVGRSSMTLAGLMKHLAYVEDHWFGHRLLGRDPGPPWDGVNWAADPDWEWRTALTDSPDELRALWSGAVDRARDAVQQALAEGGLERPAAVASRDGRTPSLRWILLHMIEEYARHNGHADLLREQADGLTGE